MKIENDKIVLENIPLLAHTSKYRFKRKTAKFIDYLAGQEDNKIDKKDYIEWQISYDIKVDNIYKTLSEGESLGEIFNECKTTAFLKEVEKVYQNSDVESSKIKRKRKFIQDLQAVSVKYNEPLILKRRADKEILVLLNELSDLLKIAYENNILNKKDLNDLVTFANDVSETIDEKYGIERDQSSTKEHFYGFYLFHDKYPLFLKNINETFLVEIVRKHMQYAMGYQNMIYLCINAGNITDFEGKSIIGRKAKEISGITCSIGKDTLIETSKAFILASQDHKSDMLDILRTINVDRP
jgi:hypothetical protein